MARAVKAKKKTFWLSEGDSCIVHGGASGYNGRGIVKEVVERGPNDPFYLRVMAENCGVLYLNPEQVSTCIEGL